MEAICCLAYQQKIQEKAEGEAASKLGKDGQLNEKEQKHEEPRLEVEGRTYRELMAVKTDDDVEDPGTESKADTKTSMSFFDFINHEDGRGFRALQSYFIKATLLLETTHLEHHFDQGQTNPNACYLQNGSGMTGMINGSHDGGNDGSGSHNYIAGNVSDAAAARYK